MLPLRPTVLVAVVVCCFLSAPVRVHAWWDGGHRIVANIAYDLLDEPARGKVVAILRQHPRLQEEFLDRMPDDIRQADRAIQDRWIFLQASIWPDLIRGKAKYDHPTWHYITNPLFLSEFDKQILEKSITFNGKLDLSDNLADDADPQELNAVQALKLVTLRLPKEGISAERKAVYYCWLMHLVGDVHQPMHSTSLYSRGRFPDGDQGGNKIPVKQVGKLHGLWDSLPGSNLTLNEVRGKAAKYLADAEVKKQGEKAAGNLTFADWIQESHALAKVFVYTEQILKAVKDREVNADRALPEIALPEAYLEDAGRIARERVVQAGYRLSEAIKQAVR